MKSDLIRLILSLGLCVSGCALAKDTIETSGGAILIGDIVSFDENHIVLLTDYAGEISVKRAAVRTFSSSEARFVRLQSGTTMAGTISGFEDGRLQITGADATLNTTIGKISESWDIREKDPELVRMENERDALKRKWKYKASVDIAGKSGNSEELGTDVNLLAELLGVDDTLKLYGSVERAEKDGDETSDEVILGSEYTSYFNAPWGWFVRGEVERDEFENLDLRTSLGAGISYRLLNRPTHSLGLRGGAGYRFESFNDGNNEDSPTLDFGLEHKWQFVSWGQLSSFVTFTPAIEDLGDFLLVQDSGMEMPLGFSKRWVLRLGVRNEFKSRPAEGRRKLDSSYYSRLQLSWD